MAKMKHARQATKFSSNEDHLTREEVFKSLLPLSFQLVRKHLSYPNVHLGEEIHQLTAALLFITYEESKEWSERKKELILSSWIDQIMEWGSSFEQLDPEEAWEQLDDLKNEVYQIK